MKKLLFTLMLLISSSALAIESLTDATYYKQVSCSEGLVLADFYASWCGPCQMIHPVLEQLESEYKGKIKFYQMDVDANPRTSAYFNIRSIPHIMVFKNGGNGQLLDNTLNKRDLKREIDAAVKELNTAK